MLLSQSEGGSSDVCSLLGSCTHATSCPEIQNHFSEQTHVRCHIVHEPDALECRNVRWFLVSLVPVRRFRAFLSYRTVWTKTPDIVAYVGVGSGVLSIVQALIEHTLHTHQQLDTPALRLHAHCPVRFCITGGHSSQETCCMHQSLHTTSSVWRPLPPHGRTWVRVYRVRAMGLGLGLGLGLMR